MTSPSPDPALPVVFTRRDAREAGMSREQIAQRIRSGGWTSLRWGAFCRREALAPGDDRRRHQLEAMAAVLAQERSLATSDSTLISARAKYAIDRAALGQILASTLDRYNISIVDAVNGKVTAEPMIPGIEPAKQEPEVTVPNQQQNLEKQEQQKKPTAPPKQ